MTEPSAAVRLAALHVPGAPLVLYNVWDAAGAKALAEVGAPAVATGSWSMAAAHGFEDGQNLPLDQVLWIVSRIVASVDIPVTVDFESGYAEDPAAIAENLRRLLGTGAAGINFEDGRIGGSGVYEADIQARRVAACREAAVAECVPLFVNARTDLFLREGDRSRHPGLLSDALARAKSYADAGADGYFVPGLDTPNLIQEICAGTDRPVNVMMTGANARVADVAALGVARTSYGPIPFFRALEDFVGQANAIA